MAEARKITQSAKTTNGKNRAKYFMFLYAHIHRYEIGNWITNIFLLFFCDKVRKIADL